MVRLDSTLPLFQTLSWSLQCLAIGRYPTHGPNGEVLTGKRGKLGGLPIAGGATFAFGQMRGDWSYHKTTLALKCYWGSGSICHVCKATVRNYTNFATQHEPRSFENFLSAECIAPRDLPRVGPLLLPHFHPEIIKGRKHKSNNVCNYVFNNLLAGCTLHSINLGVAQAGFLLVFSCK